MSFHKLLCTEEYDYRESFIQTSVRDILETLLSIPRWLSCSSSVALLVYPVIGIFFAYLVSRGVSHFLGIPV